MKLLALLALVALAAATQPRQQSRIPNSEWLREIINEDEYEIKETGYGAQREFRYIYNGQLTTGIPQSSKQHAATRVQAVVSLVFKSEDTCLLKLTHVRFGKLNRHVPNPREMLPFEMYEEAHASEELRQKLHLSVQFKYHSGMVKDIVFDGEEQPWSANIKRAVLNMIQVNLKQHGRTDLSEEQLLLNGPQEPISKEYDFFAVQEPTLEGDCETFYTVTKQPCYKCDNAESQVLNVTKSVNFEKCRRRPDIKYNFRFGEQCDSCEKKYAHHEKNLRSSTVARYNITGTIDKFLIESACVESQYIFAPLDQQTDVIATYVNQTLRLVRAGEVKTDVSAPRNPIESDSQMIYTPDWDIMKEDFFMDGDKDFLQESPYSEIRSKVDFVEQILRRLSQSMSDEKQGIDQEAPRQMARLVKVLRMCTLRELREIHEKFYEKSETIEDQHQKKVRDILVDSVVLASTKNSIQHFVESAKARKINPIKAAFAIKALVHARVVSEKQIDMVLDLCKSQVAERSPFLRQSCFLTAGSMMNALCKENADKLAVEFKVRPEKLCPRQLKEKYVKELTSEFDRCESKYCKVLLLKTLANAGLDMSVFELEKIIRNVDRHYSTIVRSQAIDALRHLRSTMPRKIQKILMPIYKNKNEKPELRMNAVAHIMQTMPERPILDQIAQQLFQERSHQVQSFVFTLLRTYANSTQPCERRMAEDLQLALRHARKVPDYRVLTSSKYVHMQTYDQKRSIGATFEYASIMTNDSYIPKELMASVSSIFMGHWNKHLAQIGFVQQNGEELIEKLLGSEGLLTENSLEQLFVRGKRSSKSSEEEPRNLLKSIFQKLSIAPRRSSSAGNREPSALLYMRFKDQDYAILPLDSETMPESVSELVREGKFDIRSIERFLSQGVHMDLHTAAFVGELQRKIPTSLGVPLVLTRKTPTIASIKGHIKVQASDNGKKIKLQVNATPKLSSTIVTKIECWTPIVNSGVKLVESIQVNLPIKTEVEIDLESSPVEIKALIKMPKEEKRIVSIESRPVSFTRSWPKFLQSYAEPEERTIHGEEWDRVKTFSKKIGQRSVGVEMHVFGQWKRQPSKVLTGTPCGVFAGPNHMHVLVKPGVDAPEEVLIKINGKMFREMEESFKLRPSMENFYKEDSEKEFFKDEECDCREEDCQCKRDNDNLFTRFNKHHSSYESQSPKEHKIDILVETKGSSTPRKAEIQMKSQCDQQHKYCKWQLECVRTPIPEEETEAWTFKAQGEYLYPKAPFTLKQLQESDEHKKFHSNIELEYGPRSNPTQSHLKLKIQGERSQEQQRLQREHEYQRIYDSSDSMFSPVSQYEQLLRAATMTQYKVQCQYKLSQKVQSVLNKAYRYIKHNQYNNMEVEQINVRNEPNKISAVVKIDPKSFRYVNVTAKLPTENIKLVDAKLPFKVRPLNIRRSQSSFLDMVVGESSSLRPKCTVSSKRVSTFDNVKYRAPITTCYSVLAKDCSGYGEQPEYVVLMKKISKNSEAKKVKIISRRNVVELKAKSNDYSEDVDEMVEIKVNGRQIQMSERRELSQYRIEREGPYVKVCVAGGKVCVYFDGYSCTVKSSPTEMNKQCGLCGHYDGETSDEFRRADNQLVSDIRDFHKSYFHEDEECDIDRQVVDNEEEYKYEPMFSYERQSRRRQQNSREEQVNSMESSEEEETTYQSRRQNKLHYDELKDSQEMTENRYRRSEVEPKEKTKVIEQSGKICFSKKPVPACPKDSYAVEYEQEKKVPFCCVPRTDPQAHQLLRQVRRERVVDQTETDKMQPSFVESLVVPKRCKLF